MAGGNDNREPVAEAEGRQLGAGELESALATGEETFRTLSDLAPVGIFLDDAQGKAIYINKKCAELIGVDAECALDFDWIPYLHPDDRELMVSEWQRAFSTSTEFRLEYRWVHKDGRIVWTLGEVIPILDDDGKAKLFIGTLTDVTARKEAELEREALQAQLVQAQKLESLGRLAGGVAHDYNNMLSAILGYTELAMGEVDSDGSVYEMLEEVFSAARRSSDITRQLLSFARKQLISPKVFDVNEATADLLNMLRRLIGDGIELVWAPRGEGTPVMMDPSQFDQLVVNLCINARDAIGSVGKIELATEAVSFDKEYCRKRAGFVPGEYVRLSVCDNGCGMNKKTLDNIFEPFFTTKADGRGTGLGLASVYGTVKQNKGFIDIDSKLGKGTTFYVYLPLCSEPLSKGMDSVAVVNRTGGGETVLVVEDEIAILRVVKRTLERSGYTVLAANTVSEALKVAATPNVKIDLLITDVIMPVMNGRDLSRELLASHPGAKCLFMSGYAADVLSEHGVLDANLHFLEKPFGASDLIGKVKETLEGGWGGGGVDRLFSRVKNVSI